MALPRLERRPCVGDSDREIPDAEIRWLTVEEVAAELRLPVRTAREYVRTGRIAGTRFGRHWRVRRDALEGMGR